MIKRMIRNCTRWANGLEQEQIKCPESTTEAGEYQFCNQHYCSKGFSFGKGYACKKDKKNG
jgi:hypothetical protein